MAAVVTEDAYKVVSLEGNKPCDEPNVRVRGSMAHIHACGKSLMVDREGISQLMQLLWATADVMDKQRPLQGDKT